MHRSPFHAFHLDHGAKMVDFAGWEMPLHYGSILEEHRRCRDAGCLFDVSHMGRIEITGRHARKLVETLVTRRVTDMPERRCRYALVCNPQGGVLDDVLVYRYEDHWLLVVNASNRIKLLQHFGQVTDALGFKVKIKDLTESTAMLAVQGPAVMDHIGKLSTEVPTLKPYAFTVKNLMVLKMTISRTGYTGEDGVEVMLGSKLASTAMKLLLKDASTGPIRPAGLGARDSLRLEAGMPLYGHELDETIDPLTAGLAFAVDLTKGQDAPPDAPPSPPVPAFIGQPALQKIADRGPTQRRVGLALEGKRTPRQGALVTDAAGETLGRLTSACLSPTLGHPIAMTYLPVHAAQTDQPLKVQVNPTTTLDARIVPLPFYRRPSGK